MLLGGGCVKHNFLSAIALLLARTDRHGAAGTTSMADGIMCRVLSEGSLLTYLRLAASSCEE
jgi:hypothetical protein